MFRSESLANISAAMAKAFPEISNALKAKVNPHLRSKYADLGAVMDAVKPALQAHGLWFMQHVHERDSAVCIETIMFHASGEYISSGYVSVPVTKADAQGYGSAMTYARRYSLSSCFGVASEDDDGHAAAKAAPKTATTVERAMEAISQAKDIPTLTVTFNAAAMAFKQDKEALEAIRALATKKKEELSAGASK